MIIAPALLAGIPSVVGAVSGFFGQKSANKANRVEADKSRAFSERMRNTEWQSAVADMTAAGINPALAYSSGGASSPQGAVAGRQESEAGEGLSSALAVKTAQEQFKVLEAQKENLQAQRGKTMYERDILGVQRSEAQSRMGFYFNGNGTPTAKMRELLSQEHGAKMANGARSVTELSLARLREPEMAAMAKLFERMGEGGKGLQQIMPLILQLLRR